MKVRNFKMKNKRMRRNRLDGEADETTKGQRLEKL